MSHFYGTIAGSRGTGTRCGTKKSGMVSYVAGWGGAIRTHMWFDPRIAKNRYEVWLAPWKGKGDSEMLREGIIEEG